MKTPALPLTRHLLCEPSQGWLTVWINRPEVKNALSNEVFEEFRSLAAALRTDLSIRGVTLRGKGGVFSAGGDLQMFRDIFQGADVDPAEVVRSSRMYGEIYREIDTLPQVVLALVEGAAIAGGLGLACVADVTIVTRSARFALTETTLGIPPAQIAPLIVRAIGPKAARASCSQRRASMVRRLAGWASPTSWSTTPRRWKSPKPRSACRCSSARQEPMPRRRPFCLRWRGLTMHR